MSAHVIPDTPENREKFAAANAENLRALGLKEDEVEVWEDGYRVADAPGDGFEWWYFDMELDDGSTLVLTFANKPQTKPHDPEEPHLLIIRKQPGVESERQVINYEIGEFTAATERCDVRMGPNTVSGDLKTYTIHIEGEGIVADVEIERVAPSWRPGAAITYLDASKKRYLGWVVPVPYGRVKATIVERGETKQLTGSAYHDHNWGNKLMGSALDYWFWGRAHIGEYTLVYVRMTTKYVFPIGQYHLTTFLLAKGDRIITDDQLPLRLETTGRIDGPGGQHYPEKLEWSWQTERGTIEFAVTNPELIEALDMSEERTGLDRLLHAAENPMYYDFNADMELRIDLDDLKDRVSGRTLFEKMMFR